MKTTKNVPRAHKFFHQFEGITTLRDGQYVSEWNQYTSELAKTPRNPNLWCSRALICLKEGYPEIALMDAKRVLLLCDESEDKYEKLEALPESFDEMTKTKRNEFRKLASTLRQIDDIRIQVLPPPPGNQTNMMLFPEIFKKSEFASSVIMLTYIDFGWFEFSGQYPWDHHPSERISATVLKELQDQLDKANNKKLKATQNFLFHEHILEEDPFVAAHNHFSDRCEYCTLELVETPGHPRCGVKYHCHNNQCKELFCNKKCYKLAMKLYRKQLCGKNIDTIIHSAQRDRPEILKLLEISLYDIQYDFWIFITLMAIIGANVFNREGNSRDTLGIFPLTSLFNHSCDPLITHLNATERYIAKDLISEHMELRQKYKRIGCNSFRFTIITLQHVKKGQEIFISYIDSTGDKQDQQTKILNNYEFICRCQKCETNPLSFLNPSIY
ncbi:10167_t:CDS:2 [Diversispora eburnea]|uniref:Histone-lysine N-methyltransferase SET5 n=1 Tax=Diversispora eburnea TaxID=1213867 RepID=A0A9N8WBF4_9GLOM|nr:10167_t:CDS:2 [Diversispora eburnea]